MCTTCLFFIGSKIERWDESSGPEDFVHPTHPLSGALIANFPDRAVAGCSNDMPSGLGRKTQNPSLSTNDRKKTFKSIGLERNEVVVAEEVGGRRSSRLAGITPLPILADIEQLCRKKATKVIITNPDKQPVEIDAALLQKNCSPITTPKATKVKTNQSTLDEFFNSKVQSHRRRAMAPNPPQYSLGATSSDLNDSTSNSPKPNEKRKSFDILKSKPKLSDTPEIELDLSAAGLLKQADSKSALPSKSKGRKAAVQLKSSNWENFRKSLPSCWADLIDAHIKIHHPDGELFYEESDIPEVVKVKCACTKHIPQK